MIVGLSLCSCGTYCDYLEEVREELIVGRVTKKQTVDWNRGEKIIYFDNDSGSLFTISLTATDKSGLFENISQGDSIIKKENTLMVTVKKVNGTTKEFNLEKKGCS
ncbi:MAG: hypothetical protein AAF901_08925 [Bacteroidota bacterium]